MEKKSVSDPSRNSGRNMPPAVYRPVAAAPQQKAASLVTPAGSGAPPVYRPYAATSQSKSTTAPPVYRPVTRASQQKTAQAQLGRTPTPASSLQRKPDFAAPPVFHPAIATGAAPAAYRPNGVGTLQRRPGGTARPAYRLQPSVQHQTTLGATPASISTPITQARGANPHSNQHSAQLQTTAQQAVAHGRTLNGSSALTRPWVRAGATLQLSKSKKKNKKGKQDGGSTSDKSSRKEFEAAKRSASDVRLMDNDVQDLPPLNDAADVDNRCLILVNGIHTIASITFDSFKDDYLNFTLDRINMQGHIRFFGSPKSGEITILDSIIGKVGYVYMYDADAGNFKMPRGPGTIANMPERYSPARQALNYLYAGQ